MFITSNYFKFLYGLLCFLLSQCIQCMNGVYVGEIVSEVLAFEGQRISLRDCCVN